jgi:hypothetical protein
MVASLPQVRTPPPRLKVQLRTRMCSTVEKAWAKLKQLLRTAKTRTAEALDQAIAELLPQITPENAQAWLRHSGITYIS